MLYTEEKYTVLNVYGYILLCENPAFRITLYNIALVDGFTINTY